MNNLLTRELPLHSTIRLWDTYLAESDGFAVFQLYVCAAFLLHWREKLLKETEFQVCASAFRVSALGFKTSRYILSLINAFRGSCCCSKTCRLKTGPIRRSEFWWPKHIAWSSRTQMRRSTSRSRADMEDSTILLKYFKTNKLRKRNELFTTRCFILSFFFSFYIFIKYKKIYSINL